MQKRYLSLISYELFMFIDSYIDCIKDELNQLIDENELI